MHPCLAAWANMAIARPGGILERPHLRHNLRALDEQLGQCFIDRIDTGAVGGELLFRGLHEEDVTDAVPRCKLRLACPRAKAL